MCSLSSPTCFFFFAASASPPSLPQGERRKFTFIPPLPLHSPHFISLPPSPSSRHPSTSPHLFSPPFILFASFLPPPPRPSPSVSASVWKGRYRRPFRLAACVSCRLAAYLLSLHCETNQWCACVRVCVISGLTAPLLAACFKTTAGFVRVGLEPMSV